MFEVSAGTASEMFTPSELSQHGCMKADPGSDTVTQETSMFGANVLAFVVMKV